MRVNNLKNIFGKLTTLSSYPVSKFCNLQNESGALSIAFIFFLVTIFASMGFVSYSIMNRDIRISLLYAQSSQAQYLAEAGIEYGIKKVFGGQLPPYSESVSIYRGTFDITLVNQDSLIALTSAGDVEGVKKTFQVLINYRPPIGDLAIYSTGDITNVTALNENGDPDPSLAVVNAPFLPSIDDSSLINLAGSQGHVQTGSFTPSHGYPNFNFYYSGLTPNVTHVQGDMTVQGGRTVYGIFVVDGSITLIGSSRVEGVLYMRNSGNIIIHGGGSPTESSVTGGVVANGDVDGTSNHITVHYNSERMHEFGEFETELTAGTVLSWREL